MWRIPYFLFLIMLDLDGLFLHCRYDWWCEALGALNALSWRWK